TSARVDSIEQTDTQVATDGTRLGMPIDASVSAINLAAFLDARIVPFQDKHVDERVVIHGGPRVDSLSYATTDRAAADPTQRTAQGFHLGNKGSIDVVVVPGTTIVTSYGEGF